MLTVRQIAEAAGCSKSTAARALKILGIDPLEQRGQTQYYAAAAIDAVKRFTSRSDGSCGADNADEPLQESEEPPQMQEDRRGVERLNGTGESDDSVPDAAEPVHNPDDLLRIAVLENDNAHLREAVEGLKKDKETLTAVLAAALAKVPELPATASSPDSSGRHWWQFWKK